MFRTRIILNMFSLWYLGNPSKSKKLRNVFNRTKKPRCLTLNNQEVFSFYFLRIFNYYLIWTSDFPGSVQPLKVRFVCKSVCHVSVCLFVCLLNVYLAVVYWFWTRWPIPRIRRNTCKHYCHFINTKSLSVCLSNKPQNVYFSVWKINVTDKLRKKANF